jgi:hypothetical protein
MILIFDPQKREQGGGDKNHGKFKRTQISLQSLGGYAPFITLQMGKKALAALHLQRKLMLSDLAELAQRGQTLYKGNPVAGKPHRIIKRFNTFLSHCCLLSYC